MPERLISHKDIGALAVEILQQGGSFHFQAHGGSMRPFIFNGETVNLTGVGPGEIRRGDVVLCWIAADQLLLHRVIQVKPTDHGPGFLIQGDARAWPDGFIPAEAVLGKATAVLRRGKWLVLDAFPQAILADLWIITIPARRFVSRLKSVVKKIARILSHPK